MNLLHARPGTDRSSADGRVRFLTKVTGATAGLMLATSNITGPAHAHPTDLLLPERLTPILGQSVSSQRWFEGGTLHRATLREWLRA